MSQELEFPRPTRIYPSKRDRWIVLLLVSIQTAFILCAIKFLTAGPREQWIAFVALGGSFLVGWIVAGTYYSIQPDQLQIRCGCFRWDLALESIRRVERIGQPSQGLQIPASGPALSLDRLRVVWNARRGTREILISPVEQDEFLSDLTLVAPWIEVERGGE